MEFNVIKNDQLFFICDKEGDIPCQSSVKGLGLYLNDTRYLNKWELEVNREKPKLLAFLVDDNFHSSQIEMIEKKDEGCFEIARKRVIYDQKLIEQIKVTNFFTNEKEVDVRITFDADFQDMFIVRGYREGSIGNKLEPIISENKYIFKYVGLDLMKKETHIQFGGKPTEITKLGTASYQLVLKPKETETICVTIGPDTTTTHHAEISFEKTLETARKAHDTWISNNTKIETDYSPLSKLYNRSLADLKMLLNDVNYGNIPVAGIPWYAVPFGRDSIITALFMLSTLPEIAKNTLRTLAHYQGKEVNPWRDEQPGKIIHELRFGELSVTNQVPFAPYYGSVDATPLFLILAGEYYQWTGDIEFIKELLPNIKNANNWIDTYGGLTETGFVTYHQEAEMGNPNHGWKDSSNSNIHADGKIANSPIALIEVQGYVYQGKRATAKMLDDLGYEEKSLQLKKEAEQLKQRIEANFWLDEEQYYAIALDENKEPVNSITSNPGHVLMDDLFHSKRAEAVAARLVSNELFSGYGIRTMSINSTGYNPMSYHNGSVWPHDNGMCLLGLSKQGFKNEVKTIVNGLIDTSSHFDLQRLPELFCGYDKVIGKPVPYPETCSPQAWAAAVGPLIVQVLLGLHPNHYTKTINLTPNLLKEMNELDVKQISIGSGHLSVQVRKVSGGTKLDVQIIENTTGYKVDIKNRK